MRWARLFPAVAAAAAALAAAVPAEAQRTGSRFGRNATRQDAGVAMQLMADCLVDRRPELVKRLFGTLPGSAEERLMLKREEGDLSICLDSNDLVLDGKQLQFTARAVRTPLARALVRKMLPAAPALSPAAPDSDPWFLAPYNALPPKAEVSREHLNLLDFGHCVSVKSWPETRAFLLSAPESVEEKAAVRRLTPILGPCLVEGMTVQITPLVLRDALAEPVYQILVAAPAAAAE